jgi:ferredoxin
MDRNDGGCPTAAVMFGVPGIRVLAAGEVGGEPHVLVEIVERVGGCRSCGVVAAAHRRRERLLRAAPFGHRPVVVMWRKRTLRCAEAACPVSQRFKIVDTHTCERLSWSARSCDDQ